ncbi:MAG: NAD(+) synthase [Lachnospiraceae bacterium]|nr:NAD(+) synthase [Lachnospiraceae bacterium]
MKNRMIKAGIAVPKMSVGDVEGNVKEIIQIIQANADCGILVFPELCITGYTCGDLFGNSLLMEAAEKGLLSIAEVTAAIPGLTVVVGLPFSNNNHRYNCAAFVSEGKINALVSKINLPTYSEFYESRWFTGGRIKTEKVRIGEQEVVFGTDIILKDSMSGAVLGTDICEDLWVPDKPSTHACLAGANIIVNPSASDEIIGKQDYRRNLVAQQSGACYCAYLYASSGVDESSTDLVFSGHGIIAENGKLLSDSIFAERSHVETAIIDLDTIIHNRNHQNTYGSENRDYTVVETSVKAIGGCDEIAVENLVDALKKEQYKIAANPFVPKNDDELEKRCKTILQIQANGLATRVRSTGIKNLVIGVSGGLDSTLALIVCNEARKLVPDIRIIGITLPSRGNTTSRTYENALELMRCLSVESKEVPIEDGVKEHLLAIGHSGKYQGEGDVTYENAQARMRTYILMDAANFENGLVVGTGDLSELALGWCTYNGDHMSMYAVNASVPKTLVQYICRAYALTCGKEDLKNVILSIVDTPISPELTPSKNGEIAQKTEEKVGKYDLNDFFMYYTLRYGLEPEKIMAFALVAYPSVTKEEMKEAMKRFFNRFFHQQFKRSCLPDGPKIGSVSLSPRGDWRMPSDANVKLWISRIEKA